MMAGERSPGRAVFSAALVLGLGLGGFLDGILLHQILGWHHLVCTTATCQPETVAELQRQNTQDGFFHLATWMLTAVGAGWLFRAARGSGMVSGRVPWGGAIAGWGAFNLVEGLVNHQLLGLHHVRPGHPAEFAFDLAFLASGVVLGAGGWWLGHPRVDTPAEPPVRFVGPSRRVSG